MQPLSSHVRGMLESDLELVRLWRNHPDIGKFMYSDSEISSSEHLQWFQDCKRDPKKHLLIYEFENCRLGFVKFTVGKGAVSDWGFYTAPDTTKGTGRQLGRSALNFAFDILSLRKVCGQALAYNSGSIIFHQKLGFKCEGAARDQHLKSGVYHDVLCFGLLSEEWKGVTKEGSK